MLSTRISIKWGSEPPQELTETIVITTTEPEGDNYYLDLRVFKEGPKKGKLDWATAGIKRWLPGSTPENPKASFTAILDSRRSNDPTIEAKPELPDEGDFTHLPNGDVLETGTMFNPETNSIQPYEEVWRRLGGIEAQRGDEVIILESEGEEDKAFLGLLGSEQIGMIQTSSGFGCKRVKMWEYGDESLMFASHGDLEDYLPLITRETLLEPVGSIVELEGRDWIVRCCSLLK